MIDKSIRTQVQTAAGRDDRPALPRWLDDVPRCDEQCPHYDGKRCELLGFRPLNICEPVVVAMGRALHGAKKMQEALVEADEVLSLCTTHDFSLPEDAEVREIGLRIGFGALMSAASKEWAAHLSRNGEPSGGQHTKGPCAATVQATRAMIATALKHE